MHRTYIVYMYVSVYGKQSTVEQSVMYNRIYQQPFAGSEMHRKQVERWEHAKKQPYQGRENGILPT